MPTVSQIRMQAAANSANSAMAKPGSTPGSSATPGGFEAFLAALDQSQMARLSVRGDSDRSSTQNALPGALRGQNLPTSIQNSSDPAKNSDPLQLLMAQLAAQSLAAQNAAVQTFNAANQTSLGATTNQSMSVEALMASLNAQANGSTTDLTSLIGQVGQQIDSKQAALISQALTKAMKANGQAPDAMMQTQVAALLQSLQGGGGQNSLFNQSGTQTPAQIASAIQAFAQKNGISLAPELQTQLTNLINQGNDQSSGIKLLGVQADATLQAGAVDPTKATTIQNLTEGKQAQVMTTAIDKLPKGKTIDGPLTFNAFNDKNHGTKPGSLIDEAVSVMTKDQSQVAKPDQADQLVVQSTKDQPDLNAMTANNSGLARIDGHSAAAQKMELKASEVSLATGPLHTEVMSAAKSGGGRIMLELTPPEQGTIRIDLRINSAGQAHLIVEGASEATKSRLDQGGQNLKNEFAQMGLNLSLDLRQGGQSQQMFDQAAFSGRQPGYNRIFSNAQGLSSVASINSIGSGDNRENSSAVHLYA
ncbi:flagellar hook-length control protein FliK [Polynucleobacter sp. MWH-UH23A]|uniref:flagellar hook-length control protein FliK n=1 Tax=Polynucleobacter sp. MWH-UH23A TaxID=1855613 RepID=UPI003364BA5C